VLWNHGGTSDAILQAGARRVVSVASPASDYLRSLPAWGTRPSWGRLGLVHWRVRRGLSSTARVSRCPGVCHRVDPHGVPSALRLSLDEASLLGAARALETTTFYGGFRLDPWTGGQVGHGIRLVRWQEGRKRVVD
jgi:hypothetical protein